MTERSWPTRYADGYLGVSIGHLLDHMSDDDKRVLADRLACEDAVIEDVTSQILEGWTEAMSRAAFWDGEPEPRTALEKARRRVALGAGEVAATELRAMARRVKVAEARERHYMGEAYRLYHLCQERGLRADVASPPAEEE